MQTPARGYELEYGLNDNIYLDCIYSTVAGVVRNSNNVSRRNILTVDDVHMLALANCYTCRLEMKLVDQLGTETCLRDLVEVLVIISVGDLTPATSQKRW